MLAVALFQVAPVGFCLANTEVFVGQHHTVDQHDECGHEDESGSGGCDGQEQPCEDDHIEITLEVDDFARGFVEIKSLTPVFQHLTGTTFAMRDIARPPPQLSFDCPAKPPPDIPVFLSLGVMRL